MRYHGPSDEGQPCAVPGCGVAGKGTLASAQPGRRLLSPAGAPAGKTPAVPRPRPAAPLSRQYRQSVVLTYQTRQSGQGGFEGTITLAGGSGHGLPRHWVFQFTYPSAQIVSVWAAGTVQRSAHAVTVTGGPEAAGWPWGQQTEIVFLVAGPPRPPAGCAFDGQPCRYRVTGGG
jgi:hypothetical protein